MARSYYMNREESIKVTKQIRELKPVNIRILPTNKEVNTFKAEGIDDFRQGGELPTLIKTTILALVRDAGMGGHVNRLSSDTVYESLPNKAWESIANYIYQESNKKLKQIKALGYLPNEQESKLIERIIKEVGLALKERSTNLAKVNGATKEQLNLTDEEWHLYTTSGSREFIKDGAIKRPNPYGSFYNAREYLLNHPSVMEDNVIYDGAKSISLTLDRLTRARTSAEEILYEGLKGLYKQVGKEHNKTVLYYLEQALDRAVRERVRFADKISATQTFKQEFANYTAVKSVKPIIENNNPYLFIKGDLDKITYHVEEGRGYIIKPYSEARGVRVLENEGEVKSYRVTYNTFKDIMNNPDFKEQFVKYEEGDWSKIYETESQTSLRLTPSFVREVQDTFQFAVVKFNANREGMNALGMALPVWRINVFEHGKIYESSDSVYDDILELQEKLDKYGYLYKEIESWKKGYDVRNGQSEDLDKYVELANKIHAISVELEPEVVKAVNQKFNKNYTKISDIEDLDFGFDSGFTYFEYVDRGKEEESREYQSMNSDAIIEPSRAITFIPRIQSLTVKGFIGKTFVKELNKQLPEDAQLIYYGRLD